MPVDVQMRIVHKIKLPKIDFRQLFASGRVQRAITGGIIDNVLKQKQADGSPLKRNALSTLDRKRRLGQPLLSLVDRQRRFLNANNWKSDLRKDSLLIQATGELAKLIKYVGQKGYVGYVGISSVVGIVIRKLVKEEIERIMKSAK